MNRTIIYEWFKRFYNHWENVHNDEYSGKSIVNRTEKNILDVCRAFRENRGSTIRELHIFYSRLS